MSNLFSVVIGVVPDSPVIATGHVSTRMAWVDTPNGRRPSDTEVETDEHNRPGHVVDVLMPLGRDGAPQVFSVTVWNHEVPAPTALQPVEFEGLRMNVRGARTGKGVEVSFSADGIATGGRSSGRRAASTEQQGEAA